MGNVNFTKLGIFCCGMARLRNANFVFRQYLCTRATLRKENRRQSNFKKLFKFHNLSEVFYFGMIRNREHESGCSSTIYTHKNYTLFYICNTFIKNTRLKTYSTHRDLIEWHYYNSWILFSTTTSYLIRF